MQLRPNAPGPLSERSSAHNPPCLYSSTATNPYTSPHGHRTAGVSAHHGTAPNVPVNKAPSHVNRELPNPAGTDSMTMVSTEREAAQEYFGSSCAGSFTRQIKAAMDARLGVPPDKPTPPTTPHRQGRKRGNLDYTLPPRRTADRLVGVYWFYVDPLYPFVDRQKWESTYESLFIGTAITSDERIFVATLNAIFALSTQLVESLDSEQRNSASDAYFRKAQELLDPNLWDPRSLDLVQFLLLMSQYLQSSSCPHQTWMVVGAAVRTAQSLGLHLPETSSEVANERERELLWKVWYGCVLMDR